MIDNITNAKFPLPDSIMPDILLTLTTSTEPIIAATVDKIQSVVIFFFLEILNISFKNAALK